MTHEDCQVLNWDGIRKNRFIPTFCLPLSHSAIRSLVSPESFTEVVSSFPREQFKHQCDREALLVPMLLNQSDADAPLLDQLRTRAHIEFTRQTMRPDDNLGGGVGMEKELAIEIEKARAGRDLPGIIPCRATSSRGDTQLPSRSSRASQAEKPMVREFLKGLPKDATSLQSGRDAGSHRSASKNFVPEGHGHQRPVFSSFPQNVAITSEKIPAVRSLTPLSTAQGKVATAPAPRLQDARCDLAGGKASQSTQAAAQITSKDANTKSEGQGTKPGLRVDKLKNLLAIAKGFSGGKTSAAKNGNLASRPATSAPRSKALGTALEDVPAKETQASEAQDGGLPLEEQKHLFRAGTPFPQKPSQKSSRPAARQSKYMLQRVNSQAKKRHAPPKANGLANKVNPCVSTVAKILSERPMLIQHLRRLGAPKLSMSRGKARLSKPI